MEQLMDYDIPFVTRDNIPNLYEHWIAKDIFAYIYMAQGSPHQKELFADHEPAKALYQQGKCG